MEHDIVADAIVVGLEDPLHPDKSVPGVFVVQKSDSPMDAQKIKAHLEGRTTEELRYRCISERFNLRLPYDPVVIDRVPRTEAGKMRRVDLAKYRLNSERLA